jgi:hypothetical protein
MRFSSGAFDLTGREPFDARSRLTTMHGRATASLGLFLVCGMLSACESSSSDYGDCDSHYDSVASASTWAELKAEIVGSTQRGRVVASLRTQSRGDEVVGVGDEEAVRVVDLLDQQGRRLVQVEVWRTDSEGWASGAWSQCID